MREEGEERLVLLIDGKRSIQKGERSWSRFQARRLGGLRLIVNIYDERERERKASQP